MTPEEKKFENTTIFFDPPTNFSLDLHKVDVLRPRTGELHRGVGRIRQGQMPRAAFLFGPLVHTHAALRIFGQSIDHDDGVGIGDDQQHSSP